MAVVVFFTMFERVLLGAYLALLVLNILFYYQRARKTDTLNERLILYGFVSSFLGIFLHAFFFLLAQSNDLGYYSGHIFYHDVNLPLTPIIALYVYIGTILFAISVIFLTYFIERVIKRTRYILTSIFILLLLYSFFLPFFLPIVEVIDFISVSFSIPSGLIVIIFIFLMTKWSSPEFKPVALIFFIGNTLHITGIFLLNIKSLNFIPLEIAQSMLVAASSIWLLMPLTSLEKLKNSTNILILLGIIAILNFTIFIIILIPLSGTLIQVQFVLIDILLITVYYCTIKDIKKVSKSENLIDKLNILKSFTKPGNLTEEEVSISKEKKICLVCKGKVVGFNSFICKCDALYCKKCAKTLSTLENACWVCEAPFDESKPVRKPEEGEQEKYLIEADLEHKKK